MATKFGSLGVRPTELVEIVSRIGEGRKDEVGDERLAEIVRIVRAYPGVPLTLRCSVSSDYDYQNPGLDGVSAPGQLLDVRADLCILQRMGLVPGDTRPAIEVFQRLLEHIDTLKGILWFDEITAATWQGRPGESAHYAAGRAKGLEAILPARNAEEMARIKAESVQSMRQASTLEIRPHHLMCMTCFHSGRDHLEPIEEDNLFEAIDIAQRNPGVPIRLVRGPCMICPPCPHYLPSSDQCIGGHGRALRDELKDLDVLQCLGLTYGDVLMARDLFTRLYARITSTRKICGYGDGVVRGPEWTICGGPDGDPRYTRGRAAGLGFLKRTWPGPTRGK